MKYIFYLILAFSLDSFAQMSFTKVNAKNKSKKGIKEGNWIEYRDSLWNECQKNEAMYYHLAFYEQGIPKGVSGDYYLND
jgi:hypothetical protein